MINVQKFLSENAKGFGTYALVNYNGITEATYFCNYGDVQGNDWFLESPCELMKICKVDGDEDDFCRKYLDEVYELEESVDEEDFINKFIKPMIVDGWLYEILNFQCSPYLPKKVENIKIISARECLIYLLSKKYLND